jgi:hypothetical protein
MAIMANPSTLATQSTAARIAGWTLLLLMVSGLAGMLAFGVSPIVDGDAVATAQNMLMHERAFRGSLTCEIVMLNCDMVLALALYALLKPVNSTLALLGSFWRIANAGALGVGIASSLVALDLFSNPKYMSLMDGRQSHALASIFFDLHKRLSIMGLMFFCFGAGIHSWLLYKSRYIPRIISALYLFACVEMLLCFFLFILFPRTRDVLDPAFIVPDALAELSAALWLALKGADLPVSTNIEPSLCDPSET